VRRIATGGGKVSNLCSINFKKLIRGEERLPAVDTHYTAESEEVKKGNMVKELLRLSISYSNLS